VVVLGMLTRSITRIMSAGWFACFAAAITVFEWSPTVIEAHFDRNREEFPKEIQKEHAQAEIRALDSKLELDNLREYIDQHDFGKNPSRNIK
jgi:hypothetical protein